MIAALLRKKIQNQAVEEGLLVVTLEKMASFNVPWYTLTVDQKV